MIANKLNYSRSASARSNVEAPSHPEMQTTIKRSLCACLAAWLTTLAFVTPNALGWHPLFWKEDRFYGELKFWAAWTGLTYLVVWLLVVFPVYHYMPKRISAWNLLAKGLAGAGCGALFVFTVMFQLSRIGGVAWGAMLGGFVVGILSPKT